ISLSTTSEHSFIPETSNPLTGGKVTATGDTLYFATLSQMLIDTNLNNINADFATPFDSGKFFGINKYGFTGCAELFSYAYINSDATKDTTYKVIGFVSWWHGHCGTSSAININLNIWNRGTNKDQLPGFGGKGYIYGTPNTSKASVTVTAGTLVAPSISNNKPQITYLASPLSGVNYDIYAGFTTSYTWGSTGTDTFGLRSTDLRFTPTYTVESSTKDTLINAYNVVQSSNVWKSPRWNLFSNIQIAIGEISLFPIIQRECGNCFPSSVAGFTNQNLTFYGSYPNPAVNSTNIKFGLNQSADVTVTILDNTGRTINTITKNGLSKGENTIAIETANLPAGNYVYTLQASNGGHVASQFTVVK
ncbi:MAG: T9SS type A sorting domain-containing protein, partial [Flavipsychrobacter sp.]